MAIMNYFQSWIISNHETGKKKHQKANKQKSTTQKPRKNTVPGACDGVGKWTFSYAMAGFVISPSLLESRLAIYSHTLTVNTSWPHRSRFKFFSSGFQPRPCCRSGNMWPPVREVWRLFRLLPNWGAGVPGIPWVDAARYPVIHRTAATTEDDLAPNVFSAKAEKTWAVEKSYLKKDQAECI